MAHNNHNFNIPHTISLSQDAQGGWWKMLSSTQIRNGQQENMNHTNEKELHLQQQKVTNNTNHIHQNVNNYSVREREEQIQTYSLNNCLQTKSENKLKCQDLNQNGIHLNQSFSQLSISQENNPKKKRRTSIIDNESNNQRVTVSNGHNNLEEYTYESSQANMIQTFKPQYLKVSDYMFKQMLSNTIKDGDKIVQCLDTNEKLQFIRRITEVTNNLHYIKLQQNLWQNYYDFGIKEGAWTTSRVSKSFAKQHYTCRTYGFLKHIIEQQLEQYSKQWQLSFDVNILSHVINECVTKGQQRLRQEFDYKMKILALDSNDHNLIRKFYELQPDKEQIDLAKMIWQTTSDELKMKEYEEILRKRIYLQRLPSGIDKIINQSMNPLELLLSDSMLDKDQCASLISTCSKTLTQYKFDLMALNLDTIQNIRYGYQKLLLDLQNKLSQSIYTDSIKLSIENRRQAMIKRHEIYLKYKLNTFSTKLRRHQTIEEAIS